MKIRIEGTVYEGSAVNIVERLRDQAFDPTEFPDVDSYVWFLQSNYIRMTDRDCPLPEGSTARRARVMLVRLAKIGCLTILEG